MNDHLFDQSAYSPLSSDLPKTTNKPLPILYVLADRRYNKSALTTDWGIAVNPSRKLWRELIEHESNEAVRVVLRKWIQKAATRDLNEHELQQQLCTMSPLRIVMHSLRKVKANLTITKLRPSNKDEIDLEYRSKYFALLWVPANTKTGFDKALYGELVNALVACNYVCKPLNKHCVYVDGPEYEWDEFKIHSLAYQCNHYAKQSDEIRFKYAVIVHQMSVGSSDFHAASAQVAAGQAGQAQLQQANTSVKAMDAITEESEEKDVKDEVQLTQLSQQIGLQVMDDDSDCDNRNVSQSVQYWEEPMSRQRKLSEIKSPKYSILKGTFRSFAFIWIELDEERDETLLQLQRTRTNIYPTKQQSSLPSYAVMKGLHKQPTDHNPEVLYNVELMAYDNCWHNLDLVVDRRFQYIDCALLLLQFLLLPFFVLFPIRLCLGLDKLEHMKARFRPSHRGWKCCASSAAAAEYEGISYFNLDKLEQLPYDLTILWRAFPISSNYSRLRECLFRLSYFVITAVVWCVIVSGPVLYLVYNPRVPDRSLGDPRNTHVDKLQFWDCFGPLIMYLLFVFTVVWWSCASRILIGPKQHLLLYHRLMLHRPVSHAHRELTRTDWGALVNLHEPVHETLFTFSYKKEFLLVQRPTDQLIDPVMMKSFTWPICRRCCRRYRGPFVAVFGQGATTGSDDVVKYNKIVIILLCVLIYIGLENLENFLYANYPFYIGTEDSHWPGLTTYNIISALVQAMFLCGFMLMWETMIFRIYGHLNSVKTLSHLIIRDTYTEYIEFDCIDNILSWLTLENFVKRKGMTLFSSVETPLLSLGLLAVASWSATIYCVVQGVGLQLRTDNSIFSNSALETWLYLGVLAFVYAWRMIYAGRKYHRETIKQSQAIKRQCRKENKNNLAHFLNKDQLSIEQSIAQQHCELLLQHIEHSEIVPRVFGIQFDELLAKAFMTALISALPTVVSFIVERINQEG